MDDRFDDLLRDAAREYNDPPETPREVMWERIVAERAEKVDKVQGADADPAVLPFRPRTLRSVRPFGIAAGIAAVLALGIGLGRLSAPPAATPGPAQPVATTQPATRAGNAAYEVATTEYLSQ